MRHPAIPLPTCKVSLSQVGRRVKHQFCNSPFPVHFPDLTIAIARAMPEREATISSGAFGSTLYIVVFRLNTTSGSDKNCHLQVTLIGKSFVVNNLRLTFIVLAQPMPCKILYQFCHRITSLESIGYGVYPS